MIICIDVLFFQCCLSDWLQVGHQVVFWFADFVRLNLTRLRGDVSHLGTRLVMTLLRLLYEPEN